MMIQTLPSYTEANYQYLIVIDDIPYNVRITWNLRSMHWHLSLYTADNISIIDNRKILPATNLLDKTYDNSNCPSGVLAAIGRANQITFTNFSTDYKLYYLK